MSKTNNTSSPMAQLHIENQRMEERLRTLKKVMAVEKVSRSETTNGGYWKSSQKDVSMLSNKTNETSYQPNKTNHQHKKGSAWEVFVAALKIKVDDRNRKIKVLTGKEQEPEECKLSCGQCDQFKASISCVECLENYCTVCFTKFHQKGALSHHHVRPFANTQDKECTKPKQTNSTTTTSTSMTTSTNDDKVTTVIAVSSTAVDGELPKGSLLDGIYNEEESSKSFQEALHAWRSSQHPVNKPQEDHSIPCSTTTNTSSCGIQTANDTISDNKSSTLIQFNVTPTNNNQSYMERLMLKKRKSDPSYMHRDGHTHHYSHINHIETNNTEETIVCSPSEHNLFYHTDNGVEYTHYDPTQHPTTHTVPCIHSSVTIEEVTECLINKEHSMEHKQNDNTITSTNTTQQISRGCHQTNGIAARPLPCSNNVHVNKTRKTSAKKKSKPSNNNNNSQKRSQKSSKPNSNNTSTVGTHQTHHNGLSNFFLMGTATTEDVITNESNENDTEYDTIAVSTPTILSTTDSMWLPDYSIVTHDDDINQADLPPPNCISYSYAAVNDNTSTSSNDYSEQTLHDHDNMEDNMFEENEEERILEELSCDIMLLNNETMSHDQVDIRSHEQEDIRSHDNNEQEDIRSHDNNEQEDIRSHDYNEQEDIRSHDYNEQEDIRSLSRMTFKELVQDFEDYQSQVLNEED